MPRPPSHRRRLAPTYSERQRAVARAELRALHMLDAGANHAAVRRCTGLRTDQVGRLAAICAETREQRASNSADQPHTSPARVDASPDCADLPRGGLLVVGAAGSGKSVFAARLSQRLRRHRQRVVTITDHRRVLPADSDSTTITAGPDPRWICGRDHVTAERAAAVLARAILAERQSIRLDLWPLRHANHEWASGLTLSLLEQLAPSGAGHQQPTVVIDSAELLCSATAAAWLRHVPRTGIATVLVGSPFQMPAAAWEWTKAVAMRLSDPVPAPLRAWITARHPRDAEQLLTTLQSLPAGTGLLCHGPHVLADPLGSLVDAGLIVAPSSEGGAG